MALGDLSMGAPMNGTVAWLERKNFIAVRSLVLYVCVYLTWEATLAAWLFAHASKFDGLGTAAVIGAVTGPIAALNGFVFKWYAESRT
jgi:hypothetical protein